jgi:hypothetical protein
LLRPLSMPDPNDPLNDDERVSKRVVYEHVSSSGSSRQSGTVIIVLAVIAIVIIAFIFMKMR